MKRTDSFSNFCEPTQQLSRQMSETEDQVVTYFDKVFFFRFFFCFKFHFGFKWNFSLFAKKKKNLKCLTTKQNKKNSFRIIFFLFFWQKYKKTATNCSRKKQSNKFNFLSDVWRVGVIVTA